MAPKSKRVDSRENKFPRLHLKKIDSHTKVEFGKHLQQLMGDKEVSQAELAKACFDTTTDSRGFTVPAGRDRISKYIRGASFPTRGTLAKIAEALGVSPTELLPAHITQHFAVANPDIQFQMDAEFPGIAVLKIDRRLCVEDGEKIMKIIFAGIQRVDERLSTLMSQRERKSR